MDSKFLTNYQPLEGHGRENDDFSPEEPHASPIIHMVPDSDKHRWNHIEDLDFFFTRVYQYHQQNGLLCMVLQQILELAQFIFIIIFTTFIFAYIDYGVLFRNKFPPNHHHNETDKITISDIILSPVEARENITWTMVFIIILASIFWFVRLIKAVINYFHFYEIKRFYNEALDIKDANIGNVTWDEVQQSLMEVQVEHRMCIHKENLTELDIYHRILRFTNYFIAMVNKEVIPLKFELPFVGQIVFLTRGLRFNIEMLLFWGPYAPFKNNWELNEEYKRVECRRELAALLNKRILFVGIGNFIFMPFILLYQILYSFFHYAEVIKREPGALGSRKWSHYGEVYLRHFNELQHELVCRLNRGYKPASQYMNIFLSPSLAVVARHIAFVCGAVLAVLIALSVYDEDVLQVEHMLTILTLLAAALACCRVFIPDENLVWCPELLMTRILAEVHYQPVSWRGKAHTTFVRKEFSQLFQYRIVHIIEELLSPLISPFILCFVLKHKALDIVDFLRNFTVEEIGVGDICSFAQMDIHKHGSHTWQPNISSDREQVANQDIAMKTKEGKTELSLLHFAMTNPKWNPPQKSSAFISALKFRAQKDMNAFLTLQEENALCSSINSLYYGAGVAPLFSPRLLPGATMPHNTLCGGISHLEGSRLGSNVGILGPISQQLSESQVQSSVGGRGDTGITEGTNATAAAANSIASALSLSLTEAAGGLPSRPQDITAVDMGLSTLYLHELHQQHYRHKTYSDNPTLLQHEQQHLATSLYQSSYSTPQRQQHKETFSPTHTSNQFSNM